MNEWIGFIVSIAIFLYLMLKNRPAQDDPEQEDKLKDFLESLNGDMKAKKKGVLPPPILPQKPIHAKYSPPVVRNQTPSQSIVSTYFEKGVEYDVIGKDVPSRAHRLLQTLKDKRDMVILHEIIGPPKCRRR